MHVACAAPIAPFFLIKIIGGKMKHQLKSTVCNMFLFSVTILFSLTLLQFPLQAQSQTKAVDVREEIATIPTQEITASPYPAFPIISTPHWKTNDLYPFS